MLIIGAGLPRTGTNSLRLALNILLNGPIYHMYEAFENGKTHADFWHTSLDRERSPEEWKEFLEGQGFRGGVDHPFSLFYKYDKLRPISTNRLSWTQGRNIS